MSLRLFHRGYHTKEWTADEDVRENVRGTDGVREELVCRGALGSNNISMSMKLFFFSNL